MGSNRTLVSGCVSGHNARGAGAVALPSEAGLCSVRSWPVLSAILPLQTLYRQALGEGVWDAAHS